MKVKSITVLAGVLLVGIAPQVQAQSLLGGIVGGSGDEALVTIGSGEAGSSGLVNVGVGGGGGGIVDLDVGGGNVPLAAATVSAGGGQGLGANVDLLGGTVNADLQIGGGGSNPGAGNGPGSGGNGGGGSGSGDNGGGETGGSSGNGGGNSGGGGLATGGFIGTGGGQSGGNGCVGQTPRQLTRLIQSTQVSSWQRASNVAVQRVALCPDVRQWLAQQLASSRVGAQLRAAVQSDALVSASLSRTQYGPEQVFAVQRSGSQLTVLVY